MGLSLFYGRSFPELQCIATKRDQSKIVFLQNVHVFKIDTTRRFHFQKNDVVIFHMWQSGCSLQWHISVRNVKSIE